MSQILNKPNRLALPVWANTHFRITIWNNNCNIYIYAHTFPVQDGRIKKHLLPLTLLSQRSSKLVEALAVRMLLNENNIGLKFRLVGRLEWWHQEPKYCNHKMSGKHDDQNQVPKYTKLDKGMSIDTKNKISSTSQANVSATPANLN